MIQFVQFHGRRHQWTGSQRRAEPGALHPLARAAFAETGDPLLPAQTSGSQRFLRGGLSAPITVTWEITAACNLTCVHCLSSSGKRRPRELTTEQALAVVDELAEMQVFQIHFGGGEPFMYPGIWRVLERCRERDLVMCVSTNGTLITPERAQRLAALEPIYFQVSLDGATPETNDRIRGQGAFRRAMRGLERLAAEGLSLTVNSVLTRYSFPELDRLYAIAGNFGAKLRVTRLRPSGRGRAVWEELHPTREQYRSFVAWLREHPDVLTADSFFHLNAFGERLAGLDMCGAATATCCICPEGEVYPCAFFQAPEFEAGNLHEQSFREIWQHSPVFAFYRQMGTGSCGGCVRYDLCHGGCPATKWFVQRSLQVRDPECVLAGSSVDPLPASHEAPCSSAAMWGSALPRQA
ncbi:mycofactocin radical SAM maturase [Thermogemmatispora tikiterensis]|uniref:Mycofactocin maturase MftC n=1 Tax=Thermogemmatispora tikiterensis TaxID=1825093 RepID=A0A328VEJ9_9CHLR|nr:mycofactocin radical SAM maturase [Thermogemmatispora tikiterensis]RAQ95261.1 mycofactocin radical SAM maturase [Thermogemmatispora tikiterensis]